MLKPVTWWMFSMWVCLWHKNWNVFTALNVTRVLCWCILIVLHNPEHSGCIGSNLHEKQFLMVEIRSIHIWSLTSICTFSLLSNQLPWIVTFFAPKNSVPVLMHHICPFCASPTGATVVTDVPPICLNSVHHFLTGNTLILPSPNGHVNWHWIFVGKTFHPQRSNCNTDFEGPGVQVVNIEH